nr:hypothetical protein [Tanacetum cinerariifolium]
MVSLVKPPEFDCVGELGRFWYGEDKEKVWQTWATIIRPADEVSIDNDTWEQDEEEEDEIFPNSFHQITGFIMVCLYANMLSGEKFRPDILPLCLDGIVSKLCDEYNGLQGAQGMSCRERLNTHVKESRVKDAFHILGVRIHCPDFKVVILGLAPRVRCITKKKEGDDIIQHLP